MSLATEMMRTASKERHIIAGHNTDNNKWYGFEEINHPTPSGCDRWLMTYSDNRGWDDEATAISELEKILPPYKPCLS